MSDSILIRPIERPDYAGWRPLWDGYNEFYGRVGGAALPEEITSTTWERFFNPGEPVRAFVAVHEDRIVGRGVLGNVFRDDVDALGFEPRGKDSRSALAADREDVVLVLPLGPLIAFP